MGGPPSLSLLLRNALPIMMDDHGRRVVGEQPSTAGRLPGNAEKGGQA